MKKLTVENLSYEDLKVWVIFKYKKEKMKGLVIDRMFGGDAFLIRHYYGREERREYTDIRVDRNNILKILRRSKYKNIF